MTTSDPTHPARQEVARAAAALAAVTLLPGEATHRMNRAAARLSSAWQQWLAAIEAEIVSERTEMPQDEIRDGAGMAATPQTISSQGASEDV